MKNKKSKKVKLVKGQIGYICRNWQYPEYNGKVVTIEHIIKTKGPTFLSVRFGKTLSKKAKGYLINDYNFAKLVRGYDDPRPLILKRKAKKK